MNSRDMGGSGSLNMWCFFCHNNRMFVLGEKEQNNVFCCPDCGIIHCDPKVLWDYDNYYKDGNYSRKEQKKIGCIPYDERYEHDLKIAKLRLFGPHGFVATTGDLLGKNILDVGASNGSMLRILTDKGARAVGVEPCREMRVFIYRKILTTTVYESLEMAALHEGDFDVVTYFDSLEHMLDPVGMIMQTNAITKIGGHLVIEQPDPQGSMAVKHGIEWKHIRPSQHVFLLSVDNIRSIFDRCGYETVNVKTFMGDRLNITGRKVKAVET